ncbi:MULTISPECIES: MGMT family protein [Bacillus]|uniref:MGMT family protein n=1 Tax=Bacillus TaxID=1386 RepID=UPI0009EBEF11|nr:MULTISPECIES: MGMT family protein [Bacillus]MED1094428.1 MGMT family protein [Bacillus capparidis]
MEGFTLRVVEIIKQIPSGKVMTYGQIAALAGNRRAARQVVRVLHSMSKKHKLPWHRVINSKGEIGIKEDELFFSQKSALESEGIEFNSEIAINLDEYQHHPKNIADTT